jgi:hypothetical protein
VPIRPPFPAHVGHASPANHVLSRARIARMLAHPLSPVQVVLKLAWDAINPLRPPRPDPPKTNLVAAVEQAGRKGI